VKSLGGGEGAVQGLEEQGIDRRMERRDVGMVGMSSVIGSR
jgi:hypothetical protein